jgi:putative membrane protein
MSTGLRRNRGFPWFFVPIAVGIIAVLTVVIVSTVFVRPAGYAAQAIYPWFPFGFFWIWPLFGFLIIFFVAKWFFWGWGWRSDYWTRYSDAGSILAERYARGEITREQFEQMKKDIDAGER